MSDTEKTESNGSSSKLTAIIVLLILSLISNFIIYYISRPESPVPPQHRVLIISIEKDIKDSDCSDTTQVENGLYSGGYIRIKHSNDGYKAAFGDRYLSYGAENSSGYMWTLGAVLNYVSSYGWTLVQAPNSGLSDQYYFVK